MAEFKVVTQKPAGVTFDLADGAYSLERLALDPIGAEIVAVSYTHLTLPTILLV